MLYWIQSNSLDVTLDLPKNEHKTNFDVEEIYWEKCLSMGEGTGLDREHLLTVLQV